MIGFIEIHKRDYKDKVLIAINDISIVYEMYGGHNAAIYLKSSPKLETLTEESYKEVCSLIKKYSDYDSKEAGLI